jgi:hypothetical protein
MYYCMSINMCVQDFPPSDGIGGTTMTDLTQSSINRPTGVHLVGSVPLSDSQEVFRTAGSILGGHLLRVPDGETGVRSGWIRWQQAVFHDNPIFEIAEEAQDAYRPRPQVRVKKEAKLTEASLGRLGYADATIASYRVFARLKETCALPSHVRFQVSLPTPLASVASFVAMESRAVVEPVYESVMLSELGEIVESIPQQELAIQWDVAVEFSLLESVMPSHLGDNEAEIVERLVRLGSHVPKGVTLGYPMLRRLRTQTLQRARGHDKAGEDCQFHLVGH